MLLDRFSAEGLPAARWLRRSAPSAGIVSRAFRARGVVPVSIPYPPCPRVILGIRQAEIRSTNES